VASSVFNALRTPVTGSQTLKRKQAPLRVSKTRADDDGMRYPSPELADPFEGDIEADLKEQEVVEIEDNEDELEDQSRKVSKEKETGQANEEDDDDDDEGTQVEDPWLDAAETEGQEEYEDPRMTSIEDDRARTSTSQTTQTY